LPKIIAEQLLLVFGITRVAGGVSVLVTTAVEQEPDLGWELTPESARALEPRRKSRLQRQREPHLVALRGHAASPPCASCGKIAPAGL
jgi:hypothetical protein